MLDVILLAVLVAIALGLGITLAVLFLARSSGFDRGDRDLASAPISFDDAIREHLELKRRNAAAERAT